MQIENTKILIVEDEPIIARNLEMILKKLRYKVSGISHSMTEAMDGLAIQNPDLVLLDINLNGKLDGFNIAKLINEKYKIPFIFITSYEDKGILDEAKTYFPAAYLVKPFREKDIRVSLDIVLHKYQNQNQPINLERINKELAKPITKSEFPVLMEIAKGLAYKEVAEKMNLSINTVNSHVKSIYSKLGVRNKAEASLFVNQLGGS